MTLSPKYDIIIIGAGPAGLECARQLGESKFSVLLLEKNEVIGPKICAGGLTGLTNDFSLPENRTRSFYRQYIEVRSIRRKIDFEEPVKTATRHDLGQHQLSLLKDLDNVTVATGMSVKHIDQSQITLSNGQTIQYNKLVGADGSTSIVRKHLGIPTDYWLGIYQEVPETTDTFIWSVDPIKIKTGYFWIFPHIEHTNIGIYFNPKDISSKQAKTVLKAYIEDKGFTYVPNAYQGSPTNFDYSGVNFDPIYLIGDAAGLISKGTGEGISFAMRSGQEVALKIMNPTYDMPKLKEVVKIKQRQDKAFAILCKAKGFQVLMWHFFLTAMKSFKFQRKFGY